MQRIKLVGLVLISVLLMAGCRSARSEPDAAVSEVAVVTEVEKEEAAVVEETETMTTEVMAPAPIPVVAQRPQIDPTEGIEAYMAEGLFISHFEADDIGIWQGYSQASEFIPAEGETPPEGYLNVSNWHAKYTDRWVQPTAGFQLITDETLFGEGAGRWSDTTESTRLVTTEIPTDWSSYSFLSFWAYSAEENDAGLQIAVYSESDETPQDDYYKRELRVDWTGWRLFELPLHEFRATRSPVGWHQIDYIKIASSGWGHNPVPTTDLIIDEMKLSNERISSKLAIEFPTDLAHPYLMLNAAEIAEVKSKIAQYPWANAGYLALEARADTLLRRPLDVPTVGGGFYHAQDDTDYAITQRHYDLADGARDLALMYQLTEEAAYLEGAKAILLSYADLYLTYEIHDKEGRTGDQASAGGRATAQGINEARWVIPLAWAYDLVFNELSEAERTAVAEQLLRPAADLIMLNNEGRHNHQAWYNAGVGVIGIVLGDKEYVWYALLKDDSGFYYQMEKSITADGMWYEGSMHYQFYVVRALLPLMEAAYRVGFDLYSLPQYKGLFDFMATYADPTLKLPTISDGRVVTLTDADRATYYEVAYRRLGDPRYVPILAASDRFDLNALLYGVGELPEAVEPAWESQNYEQSSLTVLRSNAEADKIQAIINHLGYQGGHSHADQLSLILYGLGRPLAPDPGSVRYRLTAQEGWFKQTLAHNGLVVDGVSQERAPSAALERYLSAEQAQVATVSSDVLYPDVHLERTLLLNDAYLVDIFRAESETPHMYDWVYHNVGTFSTDDVPFQPLETPLGEDGGYQYLTHLQTAAFDGNWQAEWRVAPDRYVRLNLLGQDDTTYYAARGLMAADFEDEIAEERVPLLIARRETTSTQFVSLIQPYHQTPQIEQVTPLVLTDADGQPLTVAEARAMRLEGPERTDWLIIAQETGLREVEGFALDGTLGWFQMAEDGSLQWLYMSGATLATADWAVRQEAIGLNKFPEGLGIYLEATAPEHFLLQSGYEQATTVTLEGLFETPVQIKKLDANGQPTHDVFPRTNEAGLVQFLVDPNTVYEIMGE